MAPSPTSDPTPEDRYERLLNLSPSAKYVHTTLRREGTLTQDGLAEQTLLPVRTVQYALEKLQQEDLIEAKVKASDARCRKYRARAIRQPEDR